MHRDDCPDKYTVRRDAQRDADREIHRRNPYDCDESNREYSRQIGYAEQERAEERREEQASQRRAESRRQQQRQYDDMQAEQEYYAYLDQVQFEAENATEENNPHLSQSNPEADDGIPF